MLFGSWQTRNSLRSSVAEVCANAALTGTIRTTAESAIVQQLRGRAGVLWRRVTVKIIGLFDLLYLGSGNFAVRATLEIRIQVIDVVHDILARFPGRHPFFDPAFDDSFDNIFLWQRLQALDQRRPDQTFLVRTMTTIAGRCAPGAKAFHRVVIDLVAINHSIKGFGILGGCLVYSLETHSNTPDGCNEKSGQKKLTFHLISIPI